MSTFIFYKIKAFEKMDHLARAQRMLELQEAENARVRFVISLLVLKYHLFKYLNMLGVVQLQHSN